MLLGNGMEGNAQEKSEPHKARISKGYIPNKRIKEK